MTKASTVRKTSPRNLRTHRIRLRSTAELVDQLHARLEAERAINWLSATGKRLNLPLRPIQAMAQDQESGGGEAEEDWDESDANNQ